MRDLVLGAVLVAVTGCKASENSNFTKEYLPPDILLNSAQSACAERGPVLSCPAWQAVESSIYSAVRNIEIGVESSEIELQRWVELCVISLRQGSIRTRRFAMEAFKSALELSQYRATYSLQQWINSGLDIIAEVNDPPLMAELIDLLGRLDERHTPKWLIDIAINSEESELRYAAWNARYMRLKKGELIKKDEVRTQFKKETSPQVQGALIMVAGQLRSVDVVDWCQGEWWRGELFESCRQSLKRINSRTAQKRIGKWVRALFDESEQQLRFDETLAAALCDLISVTQSGQLNRLINELDHFFGQRRNESSALQVGRAIVSELPPRDALLLVRRYYKSSSPKLRDQPYEFEVFLRRSISTLNEQIQIAR